MKIFALRYHYFVEPWNLFDFVVVILSILGECSSRLMFSVDCLGAESQDMVVFDVFRCENRFVFTGMKVRGFFFYRLNSTQVMLY